MNDQSWFNRMALIAVLTVIATAGVVVYFGHAGPTGTPAPAAVTNSDTLYLTYGFNPSNGLDQVFPANFTLPSHVAVIITITNYDNGSNAVPSMNTQVFGTVGAAERMISGSSMGTGGMDRTPYSSLTPADISHTFTVMTGAHLNVPIPPSQDLSNPSVISFVVYFNSSGSYQWMCLAPCDGTSMMTMGFMTGTVTVD